MAQGDEGAPGTVVVAIASNAGVAVAKGVVAALTGSPAMFAETIHSVVDTLNEGLLLLGSARSRRPPDAQHAFGHGQELYFWSLVVAIVIFAIGGGMGILEGIYRVLQPEPLGNALWSYLVLGFAAVLEGVSWLKAIRTLREHARGEPGGSLWAQLTASKDPAVFVVFLEDSAALIGIALAFLGTWLAHRFADPRIDAAASIAIGLVLAAVALKLVSETGGLLIGESADPRMLDGIRAIGEDDARVRDVRRVLTMYLGPENVLLNVDLALAPDLAPGEAVSLVDDFERKVRERYPVVQTIFVELKTLRQVATR